MAKFKVHMEERCFYSVEIDAENEDEARAVALEAFVQGEAEFTGADDRQVTEVAPANE